MANYRLINSDFIRDMEVTNKAKLLYLFFMFNADDLGFVGNGKKVVSNLQNEEVEVGIAQETFKDALFSLVDKGLVYAFENNYGDTIYLVRHWFLHNKWKRGLWTNYKSLTKKVKLVDNEYVLKSEEEIKADQEKWLKKEDDQRGEILERLNDDMDRLKVVEEDDNESDDVLPFEKF